MMTERVYHRDRKVIKKWPIATQKGTRNVK